MSSSAVVTRSAKKSAPKKAAKKAPGKADAQKSGKDLRRTYEHLGRVQALSFAAKDMDSLAFLTKTADAAFREQRYKESADLLRAAEHLVFASLHSNSAETVSAELKAVIEDEFEHLLERMEEHRSHHEISEHLLGISNRVVRDAKDAYEQQAFRRALEFARGAEALYHVHELPTVALPNAAANKGLKG